MVKNTALDGIHRFVKSVSLSWATYIVALFLMNVVFAQASQVKAAMKTICEAFEGILPVLAFVLFILAGLAYAAGQFFGAEMRAKAVGYAMNMLTGAILGLILSIIGPTILGALTGESWSKCSDISVS